MPFVIKCKSCGADNHLGRMFCSQCGGKLEIEDPRGAIQEQRRKAGGPLMRFVRIAVTLGLLISIVLIIRPAVPTGAEGSIQDAQRLQQKMRNIKTAVLDRKVVTQRITEGEINAYLMDLLKKSAGGSGDESVTLARINIALKTDVVVVVLEAKLGPVPLTYEISGVPERSDGQFTFAVSKVRLGHLPMPGPAGGWLAARAKVVFSKMDEEKRLLGQVSQLKVGRGEVAVATAGTP